MARSLILIIMISPIKLNKYFPKSINIVEEDKLSNSRYINVEKSENKMIKILAKSKSLNLLISRPRILFESKKSYNTDAIERYHISILNSIVFFN